MHEKSNSAEEMLEKIFYYINQLTSETDFSNSILLLTDLGRTLVNADRTSFWYRDKKNKSYWTLAASGTGRIVVSEGQGIIGASIENNETILINDAYNDARFNPEVDKKTGYITKAILCMPVKNSSGEVIAAYQAINKLDTCENNYFTEQDVKRLALASAFSGKILETHLLHLQAQMDPLTGLKNRRGFYDYYENELLLFGKNKSKSIIICDIDFFKKVNDTYGHNAGDDVLKHIAYTMKKCVNIHGQVFRWGGEEFIILLPNHNVAQTLVLAENIRYTIEQSECISDNITIKVTMSFGIKEFEHNKTLEENLKIADEKLYEAKKTGRNKIVM